MESGTSTLVIAFVNRDFNRTTTGRNAKVQSVNSIIQSFNKALNTDLSLLWRHKRWIVLFLACSPGSFKYEKGNAMCSVCPRNSQSRGVASVLCQCTGGHHRGLDDPYSACRCKFITIVGLCLLIFIFSEFAFNIISKILLILLIHKSRSLSSLLHIVGDLVVARVRIKT